jgi:hypothetical protein
MYQAVEPTYMKWSTWYKECEENSEPKIKLLSVLLAHNFSCNLT